MIKYEIIAGTRFADGHGLLMSFKLLMKAFCRKFAASGCLDPEIANSISAQRSALAGALRLGHCGSTRVPESQGPSRRHGGPRVQNVRLRAVKSRREIAIAGSFELRLSPCIHFIMETNSWKCWKWHSSSNETRHGKIPRAPCIDGREEVLV